MDIGKIEKLLRRCELEDLYEIQTILSDLIQKVEEGTKRFLLKYDLVSAEV